MEPTPQEHSRARKAARKEGKSTLGRNVAQYNHPFITTTWVTCGMERIGWYWTTLYLLPWLGVQGLLWLLAPVLAWVRRALFSLWSCPEVSPKTLPGWHMLVGEERREGVSKQTGRLK